MFESLSEKLQNAFKRLTGKGALTEKDVDEALREVRLVLLEADVNFRVVKDFVARVKERAVGQDVLKSLSPGQMVIKIVHEELISLLGGQQAKLTIAAKPPTVVMLSGLHGAGKTTTAGKLAFNLKKQGKNPLLVAADVYRPAAIKQLNTLGEQIGVKVFSMGDKQDGVAVCKAAMSAAANGGHDYVILDVAGRLTIDDEMMDELKRIRASIPVTEVLLVVDSMSGQDAVNVAKAFNDAIAIDGVIMTKLDSDARGGAALSIKSVTGKPIKFAGTSEKMDGLEPFHPDRMASRILGMGDVLSLIEKAQSTVTEEQAKVLEKKLRENQFGFDDYLNQLQEMRKMGPLDQLISMIPGFGQLKQLQGIKVDEHDIGQVEAIIRSMTKEERREPAIINGSRRRRIADGSGTSIQDVNRLIKQFDEMRKMMRQLTGYDESIKSGKRKKMPPMPFFK
ncbi:MAG: signal recognition particle protein [Armatimonadota bacterium]